MLNIAKGGFRFAPVQFLENTLEMITAMRGLEQDCQERLSYIND